MKVYCFGDEVVPWDRLNDDVFVLLFGGSFTGQPKGGFPLLLTLLHPEARIVNPVQEQ
jgi:hypothetical protein